MKNKIFALLFVSGLFVMPVVAENDGKTVTTSGPSVEAPAAATTFEGKVTDFTTGESLAGAEVSIEGTDIKAYTDLDGNFVISGVKPGKYNIICSLISYNKSLVENMSINASAGNKCEIALESSR